MISASGNQKAVLALGGGGARGLAHLGVIEVLQSMSVEIERYVGVSIGSLAGALCAFDGDTVRVQKKVVEYLTSPAFQTRQAALFMAAPEAEEPATSGLFAWYGQIRRLLGARLKLMHLLSKPALLGEDVMRDVVDALVPDANIEDAATPLSIVALDLYSGRRVVLTQGPLRSAVMASAAIPGVFPAVKRDSMLLCDIGMMDSIPARVARSYGGRLTIAVDVSGRLEPVSKCETAAEVFLRLSDIGENLVRDYTRDIADLVIHPDVSDTPWYNFSNPVDLIERGRRATRSLSPNRRPSRDRHRKTMTLDDMALC